MEDIIEEIPKDQIKKISKKFRINWYYNGINNKKIFPKPLYEQEKITKNNIIQDLLNLKVLKRNKI